jgi:hypothetical protein
MVAQPNLTTTDIDDFSDTLGLERDPVMALELYRAVFSQEDQSRFEWCGDGGCLVHGAGLTLHLQTEGDRRAFLEHLENLARRAGHADLEMWAECTRVLSLND